MMPPTKRKSPRAATQGNTQGSNLVGVKEAYTAPSPAVNERSCWFCVFYRGSIIGWGKRRRARSCCQFTGENVTPARLACEFFTADTVEVAR